MKKFDPREHLLKVIIPFWHNLKDEKYGGFYGQTDFGLNVHKDYDKGCILNSRILWFFSTAYKYLKDESLLEDAGQAYSIMKNSFYDRENGGLYWSVTFDGKPRDTAKHTYNMAFGIYGLGAYYEVTKDESALKLATELYNVIEEKCTDEYGYNDSFDINFREAENEKLSENGVEAKKTMNTLLHIMEAYTQLYKVSGNKEVYDSLIKILNIMYDKIYNKEKKRLEVFFDREMNTIADIHSFGHDIEAAWLTDECCDALGDFPDKEKILLMDKTIGENAYEKGFAGEFLYKESEKGILNKSIEWWQQAETVNGLIDLYKRFGKNEKYLESAEKTLEFIDNYFVDKREGSEWFWELDGDFKPVPDKPVADFWKCPYHNSRMCFKLMDD